MAFKKLKKHDIKIILNNIKDRHFKCLLSVFLLSKKRYEMCFRNLYLQESKTV